MGLRVGNRAGTIVGTLTILAVGPAAHAQGGLVASVHASGLTAPVAIVQDPINRNVQFAVEQGGRIRVVQSGTVLPTDFLNSSGSIATGGERGLLGLAFVPGDGLGGRFFVNFTNPAGHTVVASFRRSADPNVADPASRFDLKWGGSSGPAYIPQPYANHNGGNLAFGPDGFLYIGMGDGGSSNDPENRAQTPNDLLGKMLRLDINVADSDPIGYRVPFGNPFVTGGPPSTRPEIWSFGLRNPWRYSFDDPSRAGGFVYRGRLLGSAFFGRYFFADFVRGRVWSMGLAINGSGEAQLSGVTEHTSELGGALGNISSFGIDADGELFIVSYSTGTILRILTPTAPPPPTGLHIVR